MLFIRQEEIRSRNHVIYDTARKSNRGFLTPTVVRGQRTPWSSVWNLRSKTNWPTRCEKSRLRQISTYRPNVSIARDSEKKFNYDVMTNRKSTPGFSTSYRWSAYVTPKTPDPGQRVAEKAIFCLRIKFNFIRIKSATKFLCVKTPSG